MPSARREYCVLWLRKRISSLSHGDSSKRDVYYFPDDDAGKKLTKKDKKRKKAEKDKEKEKEKSEKETTTKKPSKMVQVFIMFKN